MHNPIKIALLGSTGSIGRQTLDVIEEYPHLFSAEVLIAGNNVDLLSSQARKFQPKKAIIANPEKFNNLKENLQDLNIEIQAGEKAINDAMQIPEVDMVVTATVGYSGLIPTLKAIEARKDIALANKETLVVAGELVTRAVKKMGVEIFPVDSEHSAIYQCLQGEKPETINRLIITASGGPFRTFSLEEMASVKAADALRHPNWDMGAKITIDSATMMNKAFEIIEATWLFDIPYQKISPVVHPQSIVHSMVEFCDGSIKAQLGIPDMRLPIKYALSRGERLKTNKSEQQLSLLQYGELTFDEPDFIKFPCLEFAELALTKGGNTACIINAANEIAVAAFLKDEIGFLQIPMIIEKTVQQVSFISEPTVEDYINTNREARKVATTLID